MEQLLDEVPAWAKVRRNQYMYSCTELAGASFEYHGKPLAILKGRIIALFYTSYRGIRFGFGGSLKAAYFHFLLLPILYVLSLTLALPFVPQRIKRFQHTESRYGSRHFSFDATAGAFCQGYIILLGLMLGGGIMLGIVGGMLGAAFGTMGMFVSMGIVYLRLALLIPVFMNMIQNPGGGRQCAPVRRQGADRSVGADLADQRALAGVSAVVGHVQAGVAIGGHGADMGEAGRRTAAVEDGVAGRDGAGQRRQARSGGRQRRPAFTSYRRRQTANWRRCGAGPRSVAGRRFISVTRPSGWPTRSPPPGCCHRAAPR